MDSPSPTIVRYTVDVRANGRSETIAFLLSSSTRVSALWDRIRKRLPSLQLGVTPQTPGQLTLHLNADDGPALDDRAMLSDAVQDPSGSTVHAVFHVSLRLRVITPELAQLNPDLNSIPCLPESGITLNSTLSELHNKVRQHLDLPSGPDTYETVECNCAFGRHIDQNATLKSPANATVDDLGSLIVIYGANLVSRVSVTEPNLATLKKAAKEQLQTHITGKHMSVIGGLQDPIQQDSGGTRYIKLPVLTFCSPQRHGNHPTSGELSDSSAQSAPADSASDALPTPRVILDLHTSETSIELTGHNAHIRLSDAVLEDCTINGVLNLYAVNRLPPTDREKDHGSLGQDAIFRKEEAWQLPLGQSERGLANLLSSLRVFAHLMKEKEPPAQDAVLHVLYLLTGFPPTVRAFHALILGKALLPSGKAAISQGVNEALKTMIPLQLVSSNPTRILEGSRLLFGLILEKAKGIEAALLGQEEGLPYIETKNVYDLRNWVTMEPVASPMQTSSGLVDRGFYDAFKQDDGILRWLDTYSVRSISEAKDVDRRQYRCAILSGGTRSQIVSFDNDSVNTSRRYKSHNKLDELIGADDADLDHLAALCSNRGIGVVPPSSLPSAEAPVLTLDREGLLSVYVGRPGCAEPGNDITLFRPTSENVEEDVDVSTITQVLVPILRQRNMDGTAVFESFEDSDQTGIPPETTGRVPPARSVRTAIRVGSTQADRTSSRSHNAPTSSGRAITYSSGNRSRTARVPDEVVVLVLDRSSSMRSRCGFIDIENNEDDFKSAGKRNYSSDVAPQNYNADRSLVNADIEPVIAYLQTHESFSEMLAIVRTGTGDFHRQKNAEKVLNILQDLASQETQMKTMELNDIRDRTTMAYYRNRAEAIEQDLTRLKYRSIRFNQHKDLLCAFLLNRSEGDPNIGSSLMGWKVGDGQNFPKVPKVMEDQRDLPVFSIPQDYICPISTDLMDDPVSTVDGFVYERRNIERWFQTHDRSPCTNLPVTNEVCPAVALKQKLNVWTKGTDILYRYGQQATLQMVRLKLNGEVWSCHLPKNITIQDTYALAFRFFKGRYPRFGLYQGDHRILPSNELLHANITSNQDIVFRPCDQTLTGNGVDKEFCLVKVYGTSDQHAIASYWEPRDTTHSLGSTVFRYYRERFLKDSYTKVLGPCTLSADLEGIGDNGTGCHHWESLQDYFTPKFCKGRLTAETVYSSTNDIFEVTDAGKDTQPLVLKLRLIETGDATAEALKRASSANLTRMQIMKTMFDGYVNRTLAYRYSSDLGLITFSRHASVTQAITHEFEAFRREMDIITASGGTACWDAINLARIELNKYAKDFPAAKLRILCLSDGEDNKSTARPYDLAVELRRDKIVVDSFCIGNDTKNDDLKTLSFLTGGYKFQPNTMEEAMAICEMEPVLSMTERPDTVLPPLPYSYSYFPRAAFQKAKRTFGFGIDTVTRDVYPKRKEHTELSGTFVELGSFAKDFAMKSRTDKNTRASRILSEIRNSGAHPHPHYDIYICEANMGLWKVIMQGPPDSTYEKGVFLMYLEMEENYPRFAPKGRFITPIYHPNINVHGKICHSIFDRNWTVDTSNKSILDSVYSLFMVPEFSDPINAVVTLNFHWDAVQFKDEVAAHIQKHATKTRVQWKEEIAPSEEMDVDL